jgi:beta-lactamase regulating signal transducer with metallopeptidase domain
MVRRGVGSPGSWRLAASLFLLIWAAGALALIGRLFRGHLLSRWLRRTAQPIDDRKWNDLLSRVANALGVRREQLPSIATLRAMGEPVTAGVLQPVVLIPEVLIDELTARQVVDVLVHECAHVIRRDPLVGLLQRLAELFFWPHPLVYFMNRRLSQAREEVCDNHVLRAGDPISVDHPDSRRLANCEDPCHRLGREADPQRRTLAGRNQP